MSNFSLVYLLITVVLAKRIHLRIKGLTIISFTNQENYRNHVIKGVFDVFLPKLRFPNRNEMPKHSFNVSYYYMFYYL